MRKIALEEHFIAPDFAQYEGNVEQMMNSGAFEHFSSRLPEFGERRLEVMDKAGIDLCVLSQTSPGIQIERDTKLAI